MNVTIQQGLPEAAKTIRQEVFVQEQGFKAEFDDIDPTAWHVVLWDGNTPVGCCRIFPGERPQTYVMGRLAVRKIRRGCHLGNRIMAAMEDFVRAHGGSRVELSAQVRVRPFYEALGYTASSDEYLDEYCPHIHMEKELTLP
ncbi:GNAT family N-acetyltransferase [Megasphaera hominis]|uniref:GNAT family N-acetyltransferase n=1 Tax=Megasphaera hominis TaxID=159836 RepID=A0ABR6VK97_9FIRM|nr:GNAT family N-acetyltransferase [Megasphaera hominis]MBC3537706.1 GNAT family N-acetyltransferase [Megasphaera hominis]